MLWGNLVQVWDLMTYLVVVLLSLLVFGHPPGLRLLLWLRQPVSCTGALPLPRLRPLACHELHFACLVITYLPDL